MRIMTSERCPECTQILWMEIDGKMDNEGRYLAINGHGLAANVWLDQNGVLNVSNQDLDSAQPTYHCHFCGWYV